MVENQNNMTMEDLDQLVADNPPGTPPPDTDNSTNTNGGDAGNAQNQNDGTAVDSSTNDNNVDGAQQQDDAEGGSKHNANEAFANMRVQNKKMSQALAAVLQQHGLDPALANNPDQLIADAENARLEAEAKKQNVPTELLQRLTQLEKANMENEQKRLTDAALQGFQAVKNKYNLSTQEISEFAKQLQDAGTNPFEQEMDLEHHYKLHNLDKIIAAESKKAVEEALRNQNNASQHSTVPNKTQGKESTGADQIDTMAQFDRFLANLK
jgi:hypothetical protein